MKRLTAFALCAVMVPAYTLGITSAFAAEPDKSTGTQQEAGDSMAGQQDSGMDSTTGRQESGMDRTRSAPTAKARDGSGMENMPKNESQKPKHTRQSAMSGDAGGAFHAGDLIGKKVKNRNDNATIGSINDLVFGEDARIVSVIVGVGGFIGMGEKEVAIAWSEVERRLDANGDGYIITVDRDEQSLKDAPAYEREPLRSASRN